MTHPKKNRYMLVDGNALIHRGYHAIPVLNTKSGEQTNAVYGFTLILLKAMADIKPTHVACTFDLKGPTFRHEKYKEYKATRVKGDQELYDQIPRVKEVVKALNIPIFEKEGFEADDLLGTLAKKICENEKGNCEVVVVTGDMDTLQLVNKCVRVYTMRKGISDVVIYDEKAVRARYGFNPNQMVDYKALRGDPSDNIPGVSGIGEKTASEIIKDFNSIEELYKEIKKEKSKKKDSLKARVLALLLEQEEQARMSFEIATIHCDVPVKIEVPKYVFGPSNSGAAVKLFSELEFKSLVGKLPKQAVGGEKLESGEEAEITSENKNSEIGKQDYILVNTDTLLKQLIKEISSAKEISIDTETTSLNPIDAKLVGVGLSAKIGKAYYVPVGIFDSSNELKDLISQKNLIGHNLKYDLQILKSYIPNLKSGFDTMIASYLLNAGTRQHNLDGIVFAEFGYQMQPITELIGTGKNQITMDMVEVEKVSWYCCEDVDMTLRLKEIFEPKLKEEKLDKVFYNVEMPLMDVLCNMELNGIEVNVNLIKQLSAEAEIEIKDLESEIHKLTGTEFNINSPKQLKEVLFDKLKLDPIGNKRTKTGISTAAGELEKMMGQHAVIPKILQYREVTKLQSTYLLALPELVNKKTGRIYTNYQQTIAATGRLSSTDPNLQNIPVKGDGMGSKLRQAFVAAKGYKLLSIDYSQIELRIVAHLAQDKKMLEVFQKGEDIHTKTAMEIFGVTADKATKDMRRDAKTINFGILYGLSSFGLSSRIGEVSRAEAKEFIAKYFAAYPAVENYIEQIKLQVNQAAFVRNELGRMRKFPEIKSSQFFIRAAAERAAVNFPIQSLAADVIKVAMINIEKFIGKEQNPEIKMLLQVHDELVFEVKENKVKEWAKKIIPLMEEAIKLSVPITVEAKVGENWGQMEKLEI